MKMTNVEPIIYMGSFSNLFYVGRGHRNLQKLLRKVFVKIKLNCEKKISHVLIINTVLILNFY